MARVNITVPDEVVARARAAGLNVSRVATAALVDELDRRAKVEALDAALTGDHRRDHSANRLIAMCQVRDVTEAHARNAARLRTATGRASSISASDAIVASFATTFASPVVLTSDPRDRAALVDAHPSDVIVSRV